MFKRSLALAAVAAATVLSTALPANAAPAQPLKFRGMTIYIPIEWVAHRFNDGVAVVTGKCGKKPDGWRTPECDAFYVLGPSWIKHGAEGFGPYTGKRPFYTSSDVQPCPFNDKWGVNITEDGTKGLRQVGEGHKAAYRAWKATCSSYSSAKVYRQFVQREWYLPKSRILIVDQWNTPGLSDALKYADWK
jgi:hypothetical protein